MAPHIQGFGLWVPFLRVPDLATFPPALNPSNQFWGAGSLLCVPGKGHSSKPGALYELQGLGWWTSQQIPLK